MPQSMIPPDDSDIPNLEPFGEALQSLRPAAPLMNRDAILFAAGRAVGGRGRGVCLLMAGILSVISITLGMWCWSLNQREPIVVVEYRDRIVEVPAAPAIVEPQPTPSPSERSPILEVGADNLPPPPDASDRVAWERAVSVRSRRNLLVSGDLRENLSVVRFSQMNVETDPLLNELLNPNPLPLPKRK
jgi:hypothetical protein